MLSSGILQEGFVDPEVNGFRQQVIKQLHLVGLVDVVYGRRRVFTLFFGFQGQQSFHGRSLVQRAFEMVEEDNDLVVSSVGIQLLNLFADFLGGFEAGAGSYPLVAINASTELLTGRSRTLGSSDEVDCLVLIAIFLVPGNQILVQVIIEAAAEPEARHCSTM